MEELAALRQENSDLRRQLEDLRRSGKVIEAERGRARREAELLAAVLDAAGSAMMVVDPSTMAYVHVNAAAAALLGVPRALMLEHGPIWTHEQLGWEGTAARTDWRAELPKICDAVIRSHPNPVSDRSEFRHSSGHLACIESVRRAVQVGGRWLVVDAARDIAAARAAARRLELLGQAIDDASDAILIVDPHAYRYVEANKAAVRLFGMPREALIGDIDAAGRKLGLRLRDKVQPVYDELIRRHPQSLTEVTEFPRVGGGPPVVLESSRRALWIDDRWMIVSVRRDITESRARQQRLQVLAAAMDAAAEAIFVIDPDRLAYLYVNQPAADMAGLPRDEFTRHGPLWVAERLGLPADEEKLRRRYADLIGPGSQSLLELETRPYAAGPEFVESTHRAALIEGRWVILLIQRDVSEREQARRELEQRMRELTRSNRDLEQFAYLASHDLQEPLRMVASFAQLLERRYGASLDQDGREFVGFIVGGATRMKQLIHDLLEYSRAGRPGAELQSIALDEPLDVALANLARVIHETGATIERPPRMPDALCDPTGVTHLLQNLIGNALKFRGERAPRVRVDATCTEAGCTVSVSDNGIGIAPEYFGRIFEIFQRLHARTDFEGTGIGLAICKRIVERHGGSIWLESAAGVGTTFWFTLPGAGPVEQQA